MTRRLVKVSALIAILNHEIFDTTPNFIIEQTGSLLWGETPTLSVSQQTFGKNIGLVKH